PDRGVAGEAKALGPAPVDLDTLAGEGRLDGVGAPDAALTRRAAELAHLDACAADLGRSRVLDDGDADGVARRRDRRDRRARERHQRRRRKEGTHRPAPASAPPAPPPQGGDSSAADEIEEQREDDAQHERRRERKVEREVAALDVDIARQTAPPLPGAGEHEHDTGQSDQEPEGHERLADVASDHSKSPGCPGPAAGGCLPRCWYASRVTRPPGGVRPTHALLTRKQMLSR